MTRLRSLLSHHLLPLLAVGHMAGIALSSGLSLSRALLCAVAIPLILLLVWCSRRASHFTGQITAIVLFTVLGLLSGLESSQAPSQPNHIYNRITEPEDAVVVGRLLAMPSYDGTFSRARVELISLRSASAAGHNATHGTILLRVPAPWPKDLAPGTLLAIRAELQRPRPLTVPGTFDYGADLARQDIWIVGHCRSSAQIHAVVEKRKAVNEIRFAAERLRSEIGHFLDIHLDQPASGLYRAILLGDRSRIDHDIIEGFKVSGTMHILAISGMHLTLVGGMLFGILYWLLRRSQWLILHTTPKKIAMALCLPLLFVYSLLAGANIPVVRAFLMAAALLIALLTNRSKSAGSLIGCGALLILAASPQALFTASFQLSFTAFSAIALFLPAIQKILTPSHRHDFETRQRPLARLGRYLLCALAVSLVATFATAPITLYHFHRLSTIGPLANLVIEPLICLWALPWGVLALPAMLLSPEIADTLLTLGSYGLTLGLSVNQLISRLPGSSLWLPPPSLIVTVAFYGSFSYTMSCWQSTKPSFYRFTSLIFFAAISTALLFPLRSITSSNQSITVHIIDVGQGSSALLSFPGDRHILIDAGGPAYTVESVGERLIAPFLYHLGIHRLEAIVLTHPDGDHTNGAPFLLAHFKPQRLYVNTMTSGGGQFLAMLEEARRHGIEVVIPDTGPVLQSGQDSLTCLANTSKDHDGHEGGNNGLVLQLRFGSAAMLFPGDIEAAAEKRLVTAGIPLASDILLAAHHGSATSNTAPMLAEVAPQLILVSAGRGRSDRYPSQQLIQLSRDKNIPLINTGEIGTIRLVQVAGGIEVTSLKGRQGNPLQRHRQHWQTVQRIALDNAEADHTSVKSVGGLRRYLANLAFSTQLE